MTKYYIPWYTIQLHAIQYKITFRNIFYIQNNLIHTAWKTYTKGE